MLNRKRMHSRSNEALKTVIDSIQKQKSPTTHSTIEYIITSQLKQKQLFQQSFNKIQKLKAVLGQNTSKQLMQELNDVIDLIKGQRVRAKITIEDLHLSLNTSLKKVELTKEIAINTDQILERDMESISLKQDKYTQTEQDQQSYLCQNEEKKYDLYYKLVCMIDKLKIDYTKILPFISNLPQKYVLPDANSNISNYKSLSQQQILRMQQVFIKKLRNMMTTNKKKQKQENSREQQKYLVQQQNIKQPKSESNTETKQDRNAVSIQDEKTETPQKQANMQQNSVYSQFSFSANNKQVKRPNQQELEYKIRSEKKPVFYELTRKRVM